MTRTRGTSSSSTRPLLFRADPTFRSFETIMDLMNLQDDIDSFQKLIFAHFRGSANNECRISALVPQVKESYGIYRFIISMLRAMYRRTGSEDALEPLKERYDAQHYALRKFYYECSNLKYLTGLINVPKLPAVRPFFLSLLQIPTHQAFSRCRTLHLSLTPNNPTFPAALPPPPLLLPRPPPPPASTSTSNAALSKSTSGSKRRSSRSEKRKRGGSRRSRKRGIASLRCSSRRSSRGRGRRRSSSRGS